jgi:predicted small lipoprotein YifL
MIRHMITALIMFMFAFGAVGCGKKGNLEDPKDEKIKYPRQYPR